LASSWEEPKNPVFSILAARASSSEAKVVIIGRVDREGVHRDTIHPSVPTKSQVNSSHGQRFVFVITH
jgi:hypothetical protein